MDDDITGHILITASDQLSGPCQGLHSTSRCPSVRGIISGRGNVKLSHDAAGGHRHFHSGSDCLLFLCHSPDLCRTGADCVHFSIAVHRCDGFLVGFKANVLIIGIFRQNLCLDKRITSLRNRQRLRQYFNLLRLLIMYRHLCAYGLSCGIGYGCNHTGSFFHSCHYAQIVNGCNGWIGTFPYCRPVRRICRFHGQGQLNLLSLSNHIGFRLQRCGFRLHKIADNKIVQPKRIDSIFIHAKSQTVNRTLRVHFLSGQNQISVQIQIIHTGILIHNQGNVIPAAAFVFHDICPCTVFIILNLSAVHGQFGQLSGIRVEGGKVQTSIGVFCLYPILKNSLLSRTRQRLLGRHGNGLYCRMSDLQRRIVSIVFHTDRSSLFCIGQTPSLGQGSDFHICKIFCIRNTALRHVGRILNQCCRHFRFMVLCGQLPIIQVVGIAGFLVYAKPDLICFHCLIGRFL